METSSLLCNCERQGKEFGVYVSRLQAMRKIKKIGVRQQCISALISTILR